MEKIPKSSFESLFLWTAGVCIFLCVAVFATPWAVYGYVSYGYADTKEEKKWCKDILDAFGPVAVGVKISLNGKGRDKLQYYYIRKTLEDINTSAWKRLLLVYTPWNLQAVDEKGDRLLHYLAESGNSTCETLTLAANTSYDIDIKIMQEKHLYLML